LKPSLRFEGKFDCPLIGTRLPGYPGIRRGRIRHRHPAGRPRSGKCPEADIKQERFAEAVVTCDDVHSLSEMGVQRADWTNAINLYRFEHGELPMTTTVMAWTADVWRR
jgi:hypothetical protein